MIKSISAILCFSLFLLMNTCLASMDTLPAADYVRSSQPAFLSYDELVQLSLGKQIPSDLSEKLSAITNTPFINNEAYLGGARPRPLETAALGPSLRVAFWNIERGMQLDNIKLLIEDKDRFIAEGAHEREKAKKEGKKLRDVDLTALSEQIDFMMKADVWVLNEVDWGVKRTEYRAVISELAQALNMNWAYGVEFLEIDPKQLGTETFDSVKDEKARAELLEEFRVDKNRLRALHGTAVLSRYPIRAARLVPFTMGYDWFKEGTITPLEKVKRTAGVFVGEELNRELRQGGRTTLYVDMDVPEAPGQQVTIAATHLENRTKPSTRRKQMNQLLQTVREISHPVIIAGDMNTTGSDSTPTSVTRMLYKQYGSMDFWTTKGIQWATGLGLVYTGGKTFRKLTGIQTRVDPTSANIWGISPNQEKGFFRELEKFRFADGTAIDFRGDPERTFMGRKGTLSNSNQRARRGFVPSFITELIFGNVRVARFRLDWIFVKANIKNSRGKNEPYIFAPHFARVLETLNDSFPESISDHSPLTVDLPFREPKELTAEKK